MPEHRWSTYDPGTKGPEYRSRSDYGFGRVTGGPPPAPPTPRPAPETRTFVSRVRDEVQAWLGDPAAEQRLQRDARLAGKPREEADYRDEDDIVWGGDSVGEAHAAQAASGYHRPDKLIEEEIADRFADAPDLDASNIRITVSGGEARLIGHVPDGAARLKAERLAERTAGVLRVWNQLEVDAG